MWKETITKYKKENLHVRLDLIPCEMSEDLLPDYIQYDAETDTIVGSCGWRSDVHRCDPDFAPIVGDDWNNLIRIMKGVVASTYARVIMVNPCVRWLKPAVVYTNCTCNKFKHAGHRGDVLSQWNKTLTCFDEYLSPLG